MLLKYVRCLPVLDVLSSISMIEISCKDNGSTCSIICILFNFENMFLVIIAGRLNF